MPAKRIASIVALVVLCTTLVLVAQPQPAEPEKPDQSKVLPALDRIKALEGEWVFADGDNKGKLAVEYQLTSGGHAVMERLFPGTGHEMITMYHLDGDKIMMTHYCAAGNNPRMHAQPEDPIDDKLVFVCSGWSNMSSEEEGHMHALTITFIDDDHFKEEWTWQEKDKSAVETFNFERKK